MNQTQQQAQRLAETYADAILRLSYAYLKNTYDAQDVCQTVFVKLLTEPREFDSPQHERAYVLRMAANACKDILKSPWRRRTCGLDAVLEVPAPPAEECTVGEILRATENSLSPVSCQGLGEEGCPRGEKCPTLPMWQELNGLIQDYFDRTTLAHLAEKARQLEGEG